MADVSQSQGCEPKKAGQTIFRSVYPQFFLGLNLQFPLLFVSFTELKYLMLLDLLREMSIQAQVSHVNVHDIVPCR